LSDNNQGVTSSVIGEKFLAIKGGNPLISAKLVEAVLKKSPTISQRDGLWFAEKFDSPLLNDEPFLICVPLLSEDRRSIIQIALVKLCGDDYEVLYSYRLAGSDESISVRNEVVVTQLADGFPQFQKYLSEGRLLFGNHFEQRLLLKFMLDEGFSLPDTTLLLSHVFKMSGTPMSGVRDGVVSIAENLFSIDKEPVSAVDFAELTADIMIFLFEKIQERGIVTVDQFKEKEMGETLTAQWEKAQFTLADFTSLEERPGVYGYKNETGEYIYIGKGANVRSRLLSYFRISDESPKKLLQLRQEAVTFTCHYCGNELEALLLESRLIQKYQPKLNSQIEIHDQKGNYQPIPTGIYLLPAQDSEHCYTLWCDENGSIVAKTFARYSDKRVSANELDLFFFQKNSSIVSVETRIAQRWLRPRLDEIDRIDTNSSENSEQLQELFSDVLSSVTFDGTIYR